MTAIPEQPDQHRAKQELLRAIAYFIERQALVARLITDLGLNIADVGAYGPTAWGWTPAQDMALLRHQQLHAKQPELVALYAAALRAHTLRLAQAGSWYDQDGHQWQYYFHGTGCQLTNQRTQEVIDWDCPNLHAFDPFFFEDHLAWQLTTEHIPLQHPHLRAYMQRHGRSSVQQLITECIDAGYITPRMTLAQQPAEDPTVPNNHKRNEG